MKMAYECSCTHYMDHYLYHHSRVFLLTTLQIGDMQSYVSKLYILLTCGGKQVVFLVDNGPWTVKKGRFKPAQLWQMMVTQSRVSPFANRRLRFAEENNRNISKDKELDSEPSELNKSSIPGGKKANRNIFGNVLYQLKGLARLKELSTLLHGCVAFELDWENLRGINYTSELQADTCVALEAKLMIKRDFDSLHQALSFYDCKHNPYLEQDDNNTTTPEAKAERSRSAFFHQSAVPLSCGRNTFADSVYLNNVGLLEGSGCLGLTCCSSSAGKFDLSRTPNNRNQDCSVDENWNLTDTADLRMSYAEDDNNETQEAAQSPSSSCDSIHTEGFESHENSPSLNSFDEAKSSQSVLRRRAKSLTSEVLVGVGATIKSIESDFTHPDSTCYDYRDILVLFKFSDPMLPVGLRKIITADQRLLKMLESGLPSWVIFLQSYPILCKIYRPWMRPVAKSLYILMSLITVIIGFYDLYKNVPLLKATAARVCGPLFDWIEAWEMVSRLKYLGTMLFLQNCEKAFKWLLLILHTIRKLFAVMMQPMAGTFQDLLDVLDLRFGMIWDGIESIGLLVWTGVWTVSSYLGSFLQLIIWPFATLLSAFWKLVILLLYPVVSFLWAFIILPWRFLVGVVNILVALFSSLYQVVLDGCDVIFSTIQSFVATMRPISNSVKVVKSSASAPSLWRSLWNDILSHVFRAVRSILNGLIAFLAACNRHRLSIYNNVSAFFQHFVRLSNCAFSLASNAHQRVHEPPMLRRLGFWNYVQKQRQSCSAEPLEKQETESMLMEQ